MKRGIAPRVLVDQVKNTAGWLWDDPGARDATSVFDRIEAAERSWSEAAGADPLDHLRLLLAAHWATVATFVPTDVDARIRHHAWQSIDDPAELSRACDVVDEIAAWDAARVSERTVATDAGRLSGHDGEWFSVRAGALGRALSLGSAGAVERLAAAIDAEVARHRTIAEQALSTDGDARRSLSVATTIAHNLGDLSRVVEAWPRRPEHDALRDRWVRLGHEGSAPRADAFVVAGVLNKALMARENHRFLALRKPKKLRAARALLLPFGPWFDAWGEAVARHDALDERDRAEVVEALLDLHAADPNAAGCLRALAGMSRATRGGLAVYADMLPARWRKEIGRGAVREALDVPAERFEARMTKRWLTERARSAPF
jgi:hypothetical protein